MQTTRLRALDAHVQTGTVVEHDGTFLRSGWLELHQTGDKCSLTIP